MSEMKRMSCPECNGAGCLAIQVSDNGEPEQQPCQACDCNGYVDFEMFDSDEVTKLLLAHTEAMVKALEGLGRVDTQVKSGHLIVEHPQGALLFREEVISAIRKAGGE